VSLGELLRAAGSERLMSAPMARELPLFTGMGFERHLGSAQPRTDVVLRCTSRDRNCERLAELCARWPGALPRFARLWRSDPELARIETLWLELDCPLENDSQPPALFFSLEAGDTVMARALDVLGRPLTDADQRVVDSLRAWSPRIALYYCGLMFSRDRAPLRLCVSGVVAEEVAGLARHLGTSWTTRLDRYATADTPVVLHVDLTREGRAGARMGIEIKQADWQPMLARLFDDGLCSSSERDEILDYPAIRPITNEQLRQALSRLLPHEATHLIKRINHVKLVSDGERGLSAKAYLYLAYW
jgi:hypothetical protein